jgi:short-subunit dehydrogenase
MSRRVISGSRAIVTGASSGIGREVALELARQGADLVLVARRVDRLRELVAEIESLGRQAEVVVGDLTEPAVRQAAVDRAVARFGGLDLLVNNAGVGALGPFESAEPQRLRRIMEVNFFALAEMTRAALPALKAGRRPMIVNIGSILGHRGIGNSVEYCASKFAVRGLTEALRAELAEHGIDVLLVSPATTETDFFDNLLERQGSASFRSPLSQSPAAVARATLRAIRSGRREVLPGTTAKLIHWANRLSPALVDRLVARRARRKR